MFQSKGPQLQKLVFSYTKQDQLIVFQSNINIVTSMYVCMAHVILCSSVEIQKYRNIEIQKYRNIEIQKYRNIGQRGYAFDSIDQRPISNPTCHQIFQIPIIHKFNIIPMYVFTRLESKNAQIRPTFTVSNFNWLEKPLGKILAQFTQGSTNVLCKIMFRF